MKRLAIVLLIVALSGCKEPMKFDKEIWARESNPNLSDRKKMLPDLIKNYKLTGISYNTLTNLLAAPEFADSLEVAYDIDIEYDVIDPIAGEQLIFHLNKDFIVTDYKVEKWSHRR